MTYKQHHAWVSKAVTAAALVGALIVPFTTSAYLRPEDVLLGTDIYAPPRNRETEETVRRQQRESALRRDEEFANEYNEQHPAPVEPLEEEFSINTLDGSFSLGVGDLELLRTIRLLERIDTRQEALRHEGAPPLAPTGAGGIIAVITMLGAVGWTLKKAGGKRGWTSRKMH